MYRALVIVGIGPWWLDVEGTCYRGCRVRVSWMLRALVIVGVGCVYRGCRVRVHRASCVVHTRTDALYGVASVSRIDKMIGLFCKRAL